KRSPAVTDTCGRIARAYWDCIGSFSNTTRDSIETRGGLVQMSSRLGLVGEFEPFYVKLLYGSSFKPPSAFQLYHAPIGERTSSGASELRPQTADVFELVGGIDHPSGLSANLVTSLTYVDDLVIFGEQEGILRPRNASVRNLLVEAEVTYRRPWGGVALFGTHLIDAQIEPKQLPTETDLTWSISRFNTTIEGARFPQWVYGFTGDIQFDRFTIAARGQWVGSRPASILNNQLFSPLQFDRTYELDSYFQLGGRVAARFSIFDTLEPTVFALEFRNLDNASADPNVVAPELPLPPFECGLTLAQRF
ncbi:MAG: hypothetical protein AAFQ82_17055, partial [Myxococcota bacterium]